MNRGKKVLIVCLTGMPGAGKSTIADGLRALYGYDTVNMGDAVREEAKRRNLEPTRPNLGRIMLELREKNGPGAVAELVRPRISQSDSDVVLVDGVRSNAEIRSLSKIGTLKVLAVHASAGTRFGFLQERGRPDDPQTRGHFEERDTREMSVGISDSIALSDYAISNAGLTKEQLVREAYRVVSMWLRGGGGDGDDSGNGDAAHADAT